MDNNILPIHSTAAQLPAWFWLADRFQDAIPCWHSDSDKLAELPELTEAR